MPKIKIEKDFTIVITWRDSSGNYVGKQRVKNTYTEEMEVD